MLRLAIQLVSVGLAFGGLISIDKNGDPLVQISTGKVRGKLIEAYDNRTGYAFLGVPFAKPPTGMRRFALPEQASPWRGILDARKKGPACPAVARLTYKHDEGGPMDEDCLQNYVYTSRSCLRKGGCSVMVVVHGGRFNFESPVVFDDEIIVHNFASDDRDVVVVAVAYRLMAFGFLNIAPNISTSAAKNVGAYDIILALEWVQREVRHFGGNPLRVTFMGHSGGGMFVDTLSLTPKTRGLFHQMIVMSGPALSNGGDDSTHMNYAASWKSIENLACNWSTVNRASRNHLERVIACLRKKSWQEIVAAYEKLFDYGDDFHGPFMDGKDGILPEPLPLLIEKRRLVPTMIGTVAAEFRSTSYIMDGNAKPVAEMLLEVCRAIGYTMWFRNTEAISDACIREYSNENRTVDMTDDLYFYYATLMDALSLSKNGNPVYLYNYAYSGAGTAFTNYMKLDPNNRPGHSEDFIYLFGMHRGNFTAKDYEIERIFTGMLVNFVRYGFPFPANGQVWKEFTPERHDYFLIDFDDNLKMPGSRQFYRKEAIDMWLNTVKRIGGPLEPKRYITKEGYDFQPTEFIDSIMSHLLNRSIAHDKTLLGTEDLYYSWTALLKDVRAKHLGLSAIPKSLQMREDHGAVDDLLAGSEPVTTLSFLFELVMIAMTAALLYFMYRIWVNWIKVYNERKEYTAL